MIDLHCHILPGVDDGPKTLADAVAMARASLADGVRTITATPHSGVEWGYRGGEAEAQEAVVALRAELARQELELELFLGLEVALAPETPNLHAQGRIFTLNGSRYLLVEFPIDMVPPNADQILFELQLRKLVPVIAHPERNQTIAANPDTLYRLISQGMLAQVTAGSLVGTFGTRTRQVAETLVERGLVQVIASDAHSTRSRSSSLSGAVERATKLIGPEAALDMVTTIPAAVLNDEEVIVREPRPAPRRSWFPFNTKK